MTVFSKLFLPTFSGAFVVVLFLFGAAPKQLAAQGVPTKQPTAMEARQMRAQKLLQDSRATINTLFRTREKEFKTLSDLHVSSASFPEIMSMLQTQRIQLTIDLAGIEAVEEMLVKQSAKTQFRESDVVIEKLKENVVLYQRYYDAIKAHYQNGTKSEQDVLSRELQLNESKVKLAKAMTPKQVIVSSNELSSVAIEKVQKQAKLAMIEALLEKYYPGGPIVDSLKRVDLQMENELSRQAQIERMIDDLSMPGFSVNDKD